MVENCGSGSQPVRLSPTDAAGAGASDAGGAAAVLHRSAEHALQWHDIGEAAFVCRADFAGEVEHELSGFVEDVNSPDNAFVARLTYLTAEGATFSAQVPGFSWSDRAGCFFYPLRVAKAGFFRIVFAPPRLAARVEISFERWRRGVEGTCRVADVQVIATSEGNPRALANQMLEAQLNAQRLLELEELEASLRAMAEKHSRTFLKLWNKPLFPDDLPFLQALVRAGAALASDDRSRQQLAQRYLWAGRSSDALAVAAGSTSAGLRRERGRMALLDAVRRKSRDRKPEPIRHKGLIYLLHNCLPFNSGGYAARAHGLLKGFERVGWKVHPFARPGYPNDRAKPFSGEPRQVIDGITYNFAPESQLFDSEHLVEYVEQYAKQVLASVDPAQIGYVQAASFYANGFAGRIVADALDVPLVYEMRGLEWFTAGSKESRWLQSEQALTLRDLEIEAAKAADHVFAITGALRGWLIEQGVPAGKISLLPNGCLTSSLQPAPPDLELAGRLGLESAFVVGYIGSIVFYEGVELVAAAIKRARALTGLDIRFLVVGDGPYYAQLKQDLRALNANEFTTLVGRVPHHDVDRYYSIVDALALARRDLPVCHYISPLKPFECMAMGKPMITSDVAAIKEIIDASGGGVTFRSNDIDQCCDRIVEMARSRELRTQMAARGREWVCQERDWAVLAEKALEELTATFSKARSSA